MSTSPARGKELEKGRHLFCKTADSHDYSLFSEQVCIRLTLSQSLHAPQPSADLTHPFESGLLEQRNMENMQGGVS